MEVKPVLVRTWPERADGPRHRRYLGASPSGATEVLRFGQRYADLCDRRLADRLILEDAAEESGELSVHERITCHFHRRWVHECISSPVHVIILTGHRWCRHCEAEASVAVDELTGSVAVTCTRCRRSPGTAATRQILRTCHASLVAARESRRAQAAEKRTTTAA
ncbi:hypothetical protein AB0L88_25510 [Saccharopolyspora shandongensis]|uniref:hypothetical protein n=1 Tax=Saccharopolyspora shandongensis TaxID=418495 RepID=UPI003441596F